MLVTCALPYANGPIHIGHILEHIQADIWVRYKRMKGYEVWFICADDSHGTAIMMKSIDKNISKNMLISEIFKEHILDLKNFNISYDNYYSTHSNENFYFVNKIYYQLKLNNLIKLKKIYQLYDVNKNMFLPDRFVTGSCPFCFAESQYGDYCEKCSATYKAIDLINPISNISNTKPIIKYSKHAFLDLSKLQKFLYAWIFSGALHKHVLNKIQFWFKKKLKLWNFSRDIPYFGFKIPDMANKFFYVWFDAPIAYMSVFKQLCNYKLLDFNEFWDVNSTTELYHFIGKDIIYFHSVFWPAILEGSGYRKPTKIFVHGHVNFHGKKLSKSKNNIISARNWINTFDSDSLRYFYASKLSLKSEDIEININEFVNKINSDIVNQIVNLASRNASFLNKYFDNFLSCNLDDMKLYKYFVEKAHEIDKLLELCKLNLVVQKIMRLANLANQYINNNRPWELLSDNIRLHKICSTGINLFRVIMICLKPIVPNLAKRVEKFLMIKLSWKDIKFPLLNHRIKIFKSLYSRINTKNVNNLFK